MKTKPTPKKSTVEQDVAQLCLYDLYAGMSLPQPEQSAAFAPKNAKTAALCFDRVWGYPLSIFQREFSFAYTDWMPSPIMIPEEIRFSGYTLYEQSLILTTGELDQDLRGYPDQLRRNQILADQLSAKKTSFSIGSPNLSFARGLREVFISGYHHDFIPVFPSMASLDADYSLSEGGRSTIAVALNNLQIVDEDTLTWDQVLEFRKDKDSRKRYRRLLHWFDKELLERPQSFIEDEISIKLEDYEQALKKHGIKTMLGAISESLDGRFLLSEAAIAGAGSLLGNPTLGLLAAGGIMVGKVAVKAAEMFLDLDDVIRDKGSEIAWVYEVKQELGNHKADKLGN